MDRREFLRILAAAAASNLPLSQVLAGTRISGFYDLPSFGNNVTLIHMTDSHAQLLPIYLREADMNIGVAENRAKPAYLVGAAFLKHYNISPGSKQAYAYSHLDFEKAARTYGKVGGFAHLATLIKKIREQRPGALLLDGGDALQGSATALYTKGEDMVEALKLLKVDVMTGHWEFTLGEARIKEIEKALTGKVDFVAHNVKADGSRVFKPFVMKEMNGIAIAIIGQAYPHMHAAHPSHCTPNWSFGIEEDALQKLITDVRKQGAQVVVLLSHNGMGIDMKLAGRVSGIDVILGGHSHDAIPAAQVVKQADRGYTLVTNAGCCGKFLGILDLKVKNHWVTGYQYKLLPVFSDLLPADRDMEAHIRRVREPYRKELEQKLAVAGDTLYRRGNFMGSFDQVILDALREVKGADIAFSPGFRFGPTLLPGHAITLENVMDMTAISYPETEVKDMSGSDVKELLEDACDQLFNPDPYAQHGADMLRVGGLTYTCDPHKAKGQRISNLLFAGKPIEANKKYKVASWGNGAKGGQPVWEVVATYLRQKKEIPAIKPNLPKLVGVDGDPGIAWT
jgi:S-sulfosulfanyl-L-cysteine sulfohydrolase